MPIDQKPTIAERLYWSYANLAMAEKAVQDCDEKFSRTHFMIRARLYAGLMNGTMSPQSLMRDQRIRMQLPQECVYCGNDTNLSIDHIVPANRGGSDSGDNAVWACRSCNSSKSDRDLFEWWFASRTGFPPLFVVRVYLKQAIAYCLTNNQMSLNWAEVVQHPFCLASVPTKYPTPSTLSFTPFHARQ
jgi:hypothetical protein